MISTYTIELRDNHIYGDVPDNFVMKHEGKAFTDALFNALDAQSEPIFTVVVIGNVTWSIEDIMMGTSLAARGSASFSHHKNMKELLVVTQSRLISMAVKGLESPIFGNVDARTFSTYNEALRYIEHNR